MKRQTRKRRWKRKLEEDKEAEEEAKKEGANHGAMQWGLGSDDYETTMVIDIIFLLPSSVH